MKQKITIIALIVGIVLVSLAYYDLSERYSILELEYGYAVEMSKICMEDSELCDDIKKKIFESRDKNDMI